MKLNRRFARLVLSCSFGIGACAAALPARAQTAPDMIDESTPKAPPAATHTMHPDAQWFGDAGFGLFLHWGLSSVKAINISWSMMPGRVLGDKRISDPAERERIIREQDWDLTGKPHPITPDEYWAMARDFNPTHYDPDKWLRAAKDAGFVYAVLTAKHHEGFALWPSKYGNFSTANYLGGRDFVKEYVEACRRNGLKVGLYFSASDWHFDRDYMSFMDIHVPRVNPEFPSLGPDLKPRVLQHTPQEIAEHQKAYAELIRGQIEELLTNYGKIDLIWFDLKPPLPNPGQIISIERIRELQPGIVINPRLHGKADYVTYERKMGATKPVSGWAEYCNTWTKAWPYTPDPFRANGYVLGQLCTSRSLGVNYLLDLGPMSNGELPDEAYKNMAVVAQWMKANGESVHGAGPLPSGESSSVPATASGSKRYLFAIPQFEGGEYDKNYVPPGDETITLRGTPKPTSVKLMGDGSDLRYDFTDGKLSVELPAAQRTTLVDVVKVQFK